MKTMNCSQLGGACDQQFHAESFDEIAKLSQQHGMEMHKQQDAAHLTAMDKMRQLMQDPAAMKQWFESKRAEFNALADD